MSCIEENGNGGEAINLKVGMPGYSALEACPRIMEEATRHRMSKIGEREDIFLYGSPKGYPAFRTELAKFLSDQYGTPVLRSDLIASGGNTWSIVEIGRLFSGAPLFLQSPTYGTTVDIFRKELRENVVAVLSDGEGIQTASLIKKIEEQIQLVGTSHVTEEQPFWGMVYVIPTFDNPTGVCLSSERCRQLVRIARQYNLLMVCDDIYGLLHYTGQKYPPLRLLAYDNKTDNDYQGNVISLGSFSKIIAPSLRAGWIEGPKRVLELITSRDSQVCGSICFYVSSVLASAFQLGLISEHISRVREIYKRRLQKSVDTLNEGLPPHVTYSIPQGGYFIWLNFPPDVNLKELCELCEKFNVLVKPGDEYFVEEVEQKYVRITFGYDEEDRLAEGVKRLCRAITKYLDDRSVHMVQERK